MKNIRKFIAMLLSFLMVMTSLTSTVVANLIQNEAGLNLEDVFLVHIES